MRTKSSSSTVSASSIKWNADDGGIVVSNIADIQLVRSLEEGVDSSKMREFSTRKGWNGLVVNGTGTRKTNLEMVGNLCVMDSGGNGGFLRKGGKEGDWIVR